MRKKLPLYLLAYLFIGSGMGLYYHREVHEKMYFSYYNSWFNGLRVSNVEPFENVSNFAKFLAGPGGSLVTKIAGNCYSPKDDVLAWSLFWVFPFVYSLLSWVPAIIFHSLYAFWTYIFIH